MIDAVVWFWTEAVPQFIDSSGKVAAVILSITVVVVLAHFMGRGAMFILGWLWAAWRGRNENR